MRDQQVLKFFHRLIPGKFNEKWFKKFSELEIVYHDKETLHFEMFKAYINIQDAPRQLVEIYFGIYQKYKDLSLPEVKALIKELKEKIKTGNKKDRNYYNAPITRSSCPNFKDPANPTLDEISLHDYQQLVSGSFKMVCRHINTVAESYADRFPADRDELIAKAHEMNNNFSIDWLNSRPYKAAGVYFSDMSNLDAMAFEQLAAMMEVYADMRDKVDHVKDKLTDMNLDFSDVPVVILMFKSPPGYFTNYLAKAWGVDRRWVRNTIMGWRSKIDSMLPEDFRLDELAKLMTDLADFCKAFTTTDEEIKVIYTLHRRHLLHLINKPIDLSHSLKKELKQYYKALSTRIPEFPENLAERIDRFTKDIRKVLVESAKELVITVEVNRSKYNVGSPVYKRCTTFLNKVNLLITHEHEFNQLLEYYIPGNKFTKALASHVSQIKEVRKKRVSKLFTAFRGTAHLAFARVMGVKAPGIERATAMLLEMLDPDVCLTRPFKSKNRKNKYLPAHLLFNKFVVIRQRHPNATKKNKDGEPVLDYLNNKDATKILRNGQPIWLGMPIYSSEQLKDGRLTGNRKGVFWFQLLPSKKIIQCLERGAELKSIRLNVPRGPTGKVIADIILKSTDVHSFAHSTAFITDFDSKYGGTIIPSGDYLKNDFNRLGKYMIAVATSEVEIDLTTHGLMDRFDEAYKKVENQRKNEIPRLMRQVALTKDKQKVKRQEAEITLLFNRIHRILETMEMRSLMVYLYVMHRTGAKYIGWDGIQDLETRNKKGTLATAITYMPTKRALLDTMYSWIQDLIREDFLENFQEIRLEEPVSSDYCPVCLSKGRGRKKTRKEDTNYHVFECSDPLCNYKGNRHSASSWVGAILMKMHHLDLPVSSIDGLDII